MTTKPELDHIVWHDLLTLDVARARRFYADLLGWAYQIEHASDFVWKPGEADYPLILANGEAHGGFVNPGYDTSSHWVAYVRVEDVDAVTAKAKALGAEIEREPFDTPGVGRSSMIRDTQGAVMCLTRPTHTFPAPSGTFLWDELVTDDIQSAQQFYTELFGWEAIDRETGQMNHSIIFRCPDGTDVAGVRNGSFDAGLAAWIPYLAADSVTVAIAKARTLGARVLMEESDRSKGWQQAVLVDPTGAMFGLSALGGEVGEPRQRIST